MITIYMIYAALAASVLANGPFECSFLESPETHQCFGAVGQPLTFYLSNKSSGDSRLLKDSIHRILKIERCGELNIDKKYANDSEIVDSGAYKITRTLKRDTGVYLLEEYGCDGKHLYSISVNLTIQAPVSKPAVSQTCLSHEQMKITCSSEGDEAEFIFTLDDKLVTQTRDHGQSRIKCTTKECSAADVSINLRGQLAGKLVCQVWNNVSKDETVIYLTPCRGSDIVKVAAITGVVSILLFAAVSLIVIKVCNKSRPTPVSEGNCENEIIYSEVKVIKNTRGAGSSLDSSAR